MPTVTGKTVYVLGAGASFHTGAPLLKDFLVTSRFLLESGVQLQYKEAFEKVFKWIDSLRGSAYYVDFDLDNLEHLFSLAEMKKQLSFDDGLNLFKDLRYLIMETLDNTCKLRWHSDKLWPDVVYSNYINMLTKLNTERSKYNEQGNFQNDVIITFNYDLMLDFAMFWGRKGINYCLDSKATPESYKLLKLHGSLNWAKCNICDNSVQILDPVPLAKGSNLPPKFDDGTEEDYWSFKMVTGVLRETGCSSCKTAGTLDPIIIPPTWSKTVGNSPIANVWKSAVEEIQSAFQIIVIGYSMPQTDTFFQYLLTLGLAKNNNLHRVIVINRDNSEPFRARYKAVFSRSLKDRGRLRFSTFDKGMTFEEFITHEMLIDGQKI